MWRDDHSELMQPLPKNENGQRWRDYSTRECRRRVPV